MNDYVRGACLIMKGYFCNLKKQLYSESHIQKNQLFRKISCQMLVEENFHYFYYYARKAPDIYRYKAVLHFCLLRSNSILSCELAEGSWEKAGRRGRTVAEEARDGEEPIRTSKKGINVFGYTAVRCGGRHKRGSTR